MLKAYACSHIKVLLMLFPDIGLEESKFSHVTSMRKREGGRREERR